MIFEQSLHQISSSTHFSIHENSGTSLVDLKSQNSVWTGMGGWVFLVAFSLLLLLCGVFLFIFFWSWVGLFACFCVCLLFVGLCVCFEILALGYSVVINYGKKTGFCHCS